MATPKRDKNEPESTTTLLIKDDAKDFARKYLLADNDAQMDHGKEEEDAEHQVRPTRLGIGAKFLPHSKAVGGFSDAVSEKIAKRITKGRRADDANDGSIRNDGSAPSKSRLNLGSNVNSAAVKKSHPGSKQGQSTAPNNRNKTKGATRGNSTGNGKDNDNDDDDGESRSRIIQKRPSQIQKQLQPQPPVKTNDEVKDTLVNQLQTQQTPQSAFPENLVDDGFIPLKTSTNDGFTPQNKSGTQSSHHFGESSLRGKKGISSAVENEPKRTKSEENKQVQGAVQETIQKTRRRTKTRSRMKNLRKDNRKHDEKPAHIQGEIIQPKTNKTRVIFKDKSLREKLNKTSANSQKQDSTSPSGVTITPIESSANKETKTKPVSNAKGNRAPKVITPAPAQPSSTDQRASKQTENPKAKAMKQAPKKKEPPVE